jgi:TrmH family RNA methyltransferase
MIITSLQNPNVKQTIRLRERREREREGLMLVEGFAELSLALESGARPQTVFYCPALFGGNAEELLARARATGAELIEVSPPVFEKIAYRENPDGWLALVSTQSVRRHLNDLTLGENALLVVAEAVEKPGNLGAILRSADAAGVHGVILCDPTTDLSNPNVVRSSRGTLFTVPVAEAQVDEARRWLHERRITLIATSPQADLIYTQADLRGPVAIAVGTEKAGLSPTWLDHADVAVRIPMRGRVNSLNVATATTLLLYEAVRQRTKSDS